MEPSECKVDSRSVISQTHSSGAQQRRRVEREVGVERNILIDT